MMIPTTLATTSRKESKLKGISRFCLRLRIMAVPNGNLILSTHDVSNDVFIGVQVFPGHWQMQRLQLRVGEKISPQSVRPKEETNLRSGGWGILGHFQRGDHGLSSRRHLLNGME